MSGKFTHRGQTEEWTSKGPCELKPLQVRSCALQIEYSRPEWPQAMNWYLWLAQHISTVASMSRCWVFVCRGPRVCGSNEGELLSYWALI